MTNRELLEAILGKVAGMEANMATKDELAVIKDTMATKDELAVIKDTMASNDELAVIRDSMASNDELAVIRDSMASKDELAEVKTALKFIKEIVIKIENDHGQKLGALFDGYKFTTERLDRIEAQVSKHEEIILRRIK